MAEENMHWSQAILSGIARAQHEATNEGKAQQVLQSLGQRAYECKRRGETQLNIVQIFNAVPPNELFGHYKIVYQALEREGFKPFIHQVFRPMDVGTWHDYWISIPI